ncbi:MAG: hypothetical protein OXC19_21630 [Bryobacterales bacterium]|nr:hypothetical protein [Bryobacterales bacterium]
MTADFQRLFANASVMLQDYYEFLEDYFLQADVDPGNLGPESHQLELFYTMYKSLSDDSEDFGEVLDTLCAKDYEYTSCTDDCDRIERRDEIRYEVLSHLLAGLERCGQDRSEILQSTNAGYVDEALSEHCSLIDDIGRGVDPDEVDIEAMIDEIRSPVSDLASSLASSSWFGAWEKNTYAIDEFAECLRKLRAQQADDLAVLKDRIELEVVNLRARFEQRLEGHKGNQDE